MRVDDTISLHSELSAEDKGVASDPLLGEIGFSRCAENIRKAVERAMRDRGKNAAGLAREVSLLVGEQVMPEQVRGWIRAESARDSLPLAYVAAVMRVLGDEGSIVRAAGIRAGGRQLRERAGAYGSAPASSRPEPHLVRAWMSANRITVNEVAAELQVTPVAVRRWMLGSMTSAKVRRWFLEHGCPSGFVGGVRAGAKSG